GIYLARFPAGNNFPVYAPLLFVLSLPLALLPLTIAEAMYWLLNVGLLLLFSSVVLRVSKMPANAGTIAGLAAVLLASRPGQANFYFGAITLPMALATLGSWYYAQMRPLSSAALLALSLIKQTFGGPLTLLMLASGRHKPALLGLLLAGIL